MITDSDFIQKINIEAGSRDCPLAPQKQKKQYPVGSIEEHGPWCLIINYEVEMLSRNVQPCPHAHTPHIHVHERYDDRSKWEYRAWVVPRVITGYLEEYGDETTATCLDCILAEL